MPLHLAIYAGLVVVLRELAEAELEAAAWGQAPGGAIAHARLRLARRNAAVMLCAWRAEGMDLGDGA